MGAIAQPVRFHHDIEGDEREARDAAIERRVEELMGEECSPWSPEALAEALDSGTDMTGANNLCRHLERASRDADRISREAHLIKGAHELILLASRYWHAKAVEQAEKEIR